VNDCRLRVIAAGKTPAAACGSQRGAGIWPKRMSRKPLYKRVLVKLSGESLGSRAGRGIEAPAVTAVADELISVAQMGVQMAVVIGGGNLIRGRDLIDDAHIRRTTADAIGMLATVINGLALRDTLEGRRRPARLYSARTMAPVCRLFARGDAVRDLEAGWGVILAGGTGNPFFTTDTCAALRALEIDAEILLKATKVDGVYDGDPEINPKAKRYEELTYEKVLADRLGVMDLTAVSMCMENHLPIQVLQLTRPGNLAAAVCSRKIGTRVCSDVTGA